MIDAVLANLREYWMVHSLLALYTVLLAHHAWTGNRKTKGLADYYVGGRNMGGWTIGLSFFATYASTNSFVGFSGRTYDWGLPWLLFIPTAVAFSLFAWLVVAPRLRAFTAEMDSLTIPDFIGFTFLHIQYEVSIIIVFFIVMTYTMIGGFISVVKTDSVQGVIMIIAALVLFGGTVNAAGGLGAVTEVRSQPGGEALFTWGGGVAIPVLMGTMFAGLVKFAVEPRQLSRFFALEGEKATRTGMIVSSVTFAAVFSLLIPVGIYARKIIPGGLPDTDLVVPTLLTEVFGPGTGAFLLVAMVAAAMSSLDSVLLVMASTTERDLVSVIAPGRSEASEMFWTRGWVALFALITAIISLNPPAGIVELTAFSGSLYGACFFPAIVFGLHWRRGSGAAVISSFIVGIVVLLTWDFVPGSAILHEVFPAMLLSTAAFYGVSLMTEDSANETVLALMAEAEAS
jgi:Na+/pantothenate symporter